MTPRAASMSVLPPVARVFAAALRALSRASFPILLLALVRANDPPLTPGVLARALVALALLPELAAWLVLRALAAEGRVESGKLRLGGELQRVELPTSAIERVEAWRLPLPSAGLSLRLHSGTPLGVGLAAPEPAPLLAELERAGVAVPPSDDANLAWATARSACPRRWWDHATAKLGLASLVPAAIAFNAHQHIAFGAFLGEYYLMGLRAWLTSAGSYWLASLLYLVLWAGCFRVAVELLTWLAAFAAPVRAGAVRRAVERTAALLYYASIPLLLALRFLA
jgi:apolipoprotein N-acyltransferase